MRSGVEIVVCDVNETLSDMAPLQQRFLDVGASGELSRFWFASVLRDGFALAAAGASAPFSTLAAGALRAALASGGLAAGTVDDAVTHIMAGFRDLTVHPDVVAGVLALRAAGYTLVTLSNGATDVADRLLGNAGIRDEFECLLSVDATTAWKPARAAYEYAAGRLSVPTHRMALVAVHPWDIDGASRAGLTTAWINRESGDYPPYFTRPSVEVAALTDLPQALSVRASSAGQEQG